MLPVDFQFAGYAEVSYATGSLEMMEGGVVIGAKTKEFSKDISPIPIVPWFFLKFTFQADLNGKFGFIKVSTVGKTAFEPKVNLDFGAETTATANAGVRRLAYAGGGFKGNLDAALKLPLKDGQLSKSLTVDLSGSLTFELKILGWKKNKDFGMIGPYCIYPWRSGRSFAMLSMDGLDDGFTLIGYPTPIMARSSGSYEYEKNAVYEDSAPQLVQLPDGTMILVWVDAVAGRSDANMTGLYYAYKSTAGNWSTPVLVDDDGTSDFLPVLAVSNTGTPVLVWQNVKTAWTSAPEQVEDVAANIELKSAVYDTASNTFGSVATLTDGDKYSTAVQLVPSSSGMTAYWVETEPENLLLGENLDATIRTSSWNGSAWDMSSAVATVGSLDGFAAGQIGGAGCIAYAEGSTITANGATLTANGTVSSLQIAGGSLYWSDANGLNEWIGSGAPTCDGALALDDFTVLTNGGQRALLIRQYTDDAHELYASAYTSTGWSTPVPITEYGNLSLSDPSAVLVSDGSIYWACGRVGSGSDLVVDSYTPTANVVVGDEAYISDMITAGETAYASVDLRNIGLAVAPISASVQINGTTQAAGIYRFSEDEPEVVTQLSAGEYLDAGIRFTAPASMNGETVTFTFKDAAGNVLGTAVGTLPAAAPDVEVTDVTTNGKTVTATVANIGAASASNVSVNLTQEGVEETLGTQIVSLSVGARQTVSFPIGVGADLTPKTRYDYKRFIVTAEPAVNEVMLGNNSDSTLITPKTVEAITIDGKKHVSMKGGERLSLTYAITPADAPADIAWMSTRNSVATVDAHGTVSAWNDGEADIIASYILDDGTALQDKITVTVTEGISHATGVNGVTINPSSITVGIGKTATLTAIVSPSTAIDQSVTWHVENEDILRTTPGADNTLLVEGVTEGETTATVRTNDGAYTATATITVSTSSGHTHRWTGDWSSDANSHWHNCAAANCSITANNQKDGFAAHISDGGKVTTAATASQDGVRTYSCTVCGYVIRTERIPATGDGSSSGGSSSGRGGTSGGSSHDVSVPSRVSGGSVRVSPSSAKEGTTVTITAIPDDGYTLDRLTVTDGVGNTIRTTDEGNGKYTFTMPGSKVTLDASFAVRTATETTAHSIHFTDVPSGAYYADAVAWAVQQGITAGTSATMFSPNASCTRAQMVTFLWRAAGSPSAQGNANPFTDVAPGAYYYDAVLWAVERGITSGTSATAFSPDAAVTRGQTVAFLHRAAGSPTADGSTPFADVASDAFYASAVQWAVGKGVTSGTSATTFSPDNNCTRAEIAAFLYRDRVN